MSSRLLIVASLIGLPVCALSAQRGGDLLSDPSRLTPLNVTATRVQYRGRDAIRLVRASGNEGVGGNTIAILRDLDFRDGVIEADIVGVPLPGADTSFRGFVGIAFRVDSSGDRHGAFYLRPTNGRAMDQLRRNHSTQYVVHPDYPWHRLRREQPGVYESYVDLEPGAWTSIRIEVNQGVAQLFVHGVEQPTLVVTDMKNPPASGRVALWIGAGTEAFFSRLRVTPAKLPGDDR